MSALTTKKPLKVMKMAYQVWCYLASTLGEGLVFRGTSPELMVYTDASFGEEHAHGCVIVKWGEDPLVWRSSRQCMLTTSTAEAELVEVMEGAVTTEALRLMIEEVLDGPVRCWQFTDSSSALTIIIGDTASWRTRHLRKRARFLRWKALRGDVLMRHQPGAEMVADMGTKPLASVKLKEHKQRLGMILQEESTKVKEEKIQGGRESESQDGRKLRLALMMALLARGKAQPSQEEQRSDQKEFEKMMVVYTILVIVGAIVVQKLWKWICQKMRSESKVCSDEKSEQEVMVKRPACLEVWSGLEDHVVEETTCGLAPTRKKEGDQKEKKEVSGSRDLQASSSSSGVTTQKPEAGQRNKITKTENASTRESPWVVAGSGVRYHRLRHCTGVKMSKSIREVKLCQRCWAENDSNNPNEATLFAKNIDGEMHFSRKHYDQCHPGVKPRIFEPCQVCRPSRKG